MPTRYEAVSAPRFRLEKIEGIDQIDIPAKRSAWALFLVVWLCGWTVGGFSAATQLFSGRGGAPFLVFWLFGWAFGELFAAASLAWIMFGVERLRVIGSDLEVSYRLLSLSKTAFYRGSEIRNLSACVPMSYGRNVQFSLPFLKSNKLGSIRFTYGAPTIFLAGSLDEAEGQLIVDQLRQHLG